MTKSHFYTGLLLTTLTTGMTLWVFYRLVPQAEYWSFAAILSTAMIFLSISIYSAALKASHDKNPNTFSQKFLGFTGGKILMCLLIAGLYKLTLPNVEKTYLYTFLWIYIFYTAFETYVFMKLARPKEQAD